MPQRRRLTAARATFAVLLLLGTLLAAFPGTAVAADNAASQEGFDRVWARTDVPEARGDRTFIWGPEPLVPFVVMEPMAGLGPAESEAMIAALGKLKGSIAMLLVEHDMDAVFQLADRISVLVYGRIIATGTVDDIRSNAEVRTAYLGEGDEAC